MKIRAVSFCLAVAAAMPASSALAGDASHLNILGFSGDGSIFAFEEYGVQDGSGFPYANRFYIDTASDSFVSPSPIRIRLDDETADIAAAREQARLAGEAIVSDAELADNPGYLAGFNAVTELSADPFRIVVNPRPVLPPIDDPLEFRLEEISFAASGTCAGLNDTTRGFRLVAIDSEPGGTTRLLHEDSSVPGSRGCALGYRIGGVQTFMPHQGLSALAVLISVESFGFEGPDHRWMAVTMRPAK
jgi:predicted secreted protein